MRNLTLSRLLGVALGLAATDPKALAEETGPAQGAPPSATIVITQAVDRAFCESFVARGKAVQWSGVTGIRPEIENGDGIDFRQGAEQILPDALAKRVVDYYPQRYHMDLDNDGRSDEVLWVWSDSHYFRGDYIVLLPPEGNALRDLALRPRGDEDVAPYLARLQQAGLVVYSGLATAYPSNFNAERYTHFFPIAVGGTTYLWARPENEDLTPLALLYRPGPGGKLDPVCTFDWVWRVKEPTP